MFNKAIKALLIHINIVYNRRILTQTFYVI